MLIVCCLFIAAIETDSVKKQYVKILESYGCLGVLSVPVG